MTLTGDQQQQQKRAGLIFKSEDRCHCTSHSNDTIMHSVTLLLVSLFLISVSGKPTEPKCSSEGLTCQTDEEKCCDGLSCLVSGDDRVRRCFQLLPSVEYEEITCMDKKLPYYGEKEVSPHRLLKACCTTEDAWMKESNSDCCLLSGSVYRKKVPIPCCRKQTASDRNGTLTCPPESGNPLDDDVVDLP